MSNEVKPGRYRHYKGGNEYTVLQTAKSTEDEAEVVVYRAEYGTHQIWVRPLKQFCDKVCVAGKLVNRFERIPEGDDDYLAHEYDDLIARLRSIESRSKGELLTEAANAIEDLRLSRNNWRDVASRSAADLNAAKKEIRALRRLWEMGRGNGKVVTYAAECKIPRVQYDAISPESRGEVIKQRLREKVVSLMVDRIYDDRVFTRITSYDAAANTINVMDQINVIIPEVDDE